MPKRMSQKQKHRWLIEVLSKYVKTVTDDGVFVECGVRQGTSSRIMASVLRRQGYLFDTWSGFPHFSAKHDIPSNSESRKKRLLRRVQTKDDSLKACKRQMQKYGVLDLCKFIKGDICETVPNLDKGGLSVCMMHIDTDLYKPAKIAMENFYRYVMKDAVVVFHDYMDPKWPGISKVVNNFIENNKSWNLIDMNKVINVHVAILINGDPDLCKQYITSLWSKEH